MARTMPTEESLGLSPTDDELATVTTPVNDDDDISQDDDPAPEPVAVAPDAAPAVADAAKPAEDPKTVDLRALQEARAEAREAKTRAAVLEQRWNDFLAGQNKPEPKPAAAPEIPKWDQDPLAAGQWTQQQIIDMNERNAATARETQEREQAEREFSQVFQKIDADYTQAVAADPTINEAYNALRKSQGEELLAMGYSIPDAQAELARIERSHVQYVAGKGLPIGQYIKAMAAARGWQAAAPVPTPPAKTDLVAVAAAQQRHQSLSDAPGGEAIPLLDAKALARMTDKDFKAWMSKKGNEQRFDDIMGKS